MPLPVSLLSKDELQDHDFDVLRGSWPDDLTGELVISAPHPETFGGPHAFFGDGMLYRLSLQPGSFGAAPGTFAWRQRLLDTPSARLRAKRPDVFNPTMVGLNSPFGLTNAVNTAPLPWGDRLLVTWDVGRPAEIDPVSMEFLGEVGRREEWLEMIPHPVLPMVATTSHPVIDPDRNVLWGVNTLWGQLHVIRWDGEGAVQRWPIAGATVPQSVHTITQTREWLIVADCAFKVEPQVVFGGERTEPANADEPVYLIRKDRIEATPPGHEVGYDAVFTLAPETNHYYANYEDTDGIRVLFEHTQNADLAMAQGPGDVDALGRPCDPRRKGFYGMPMSPTRTTFAELDPSTARLRTTAELYEPELLWSGQLSAMDWSKEGMEHRTLHHMVFQGWHPEAITQKMLALYKDRVDRSLWPTGDRPAVVASMSVPDLRLAAHHELAVGDFPSSPIFVPSDPGVDSSKTSYAGSDPGGHDGYLVVPVMNDDGFRVDAYDAGDVSKGPIASIGTRGVTIPFFLHSAWMPRVVEAPDLPRTRFSDELDRADELHDDLAAVAREVGRELDERVPIG